MADPNDVKVSGDVKVVTPPPPPPPAEPKKEEKKDEKPAEAKDASSGISADTKSVYLAPEFSYGCRGFGNSEENAHCGPSFGITAGYPTLWFGDKFYLRAPEIRYQKEWVSRSIPAEFGPGMESSANIDKLGIGLTGGFLPHRFFGIELGAIIGAAHLGSTAEDNGRKGLRYADNRFAYSADNWGLDVGARLALAFPEQKVTSWLQMGGKVFGSVGYNPWSLTPDSISRPASDPAIPVNSVFWNVGGALTFRIGEVGKPHTSRVEAEKTPAVAPAPKAAPVADLPQGVKDLQAMVDPVKAETKKQLELKYAESAAGYAKQATEKAASKKKDDHAIALDTAKLAVEESKKSGLAYKVANDAAVKAEAALAKLKEDKNLKPEHLKLAEEAVAAIKAEADKLKEESHKAWESAGAAVKAYNSIKGLPKKEHIEFKDEDPAKASAPAAEAKKEEPTKPAEDKAKPKGIE